MKLSGNIGYLAKTLGYEKAARLFQKVGISLLDFSGSFAPEARARTESILEIFDRYGLSVYQTHAPFNRYQNKDTKEHTAAILETLRFTAEVGAKYMVVHGDEFDFAGLSYSFDEALRYNYDYFAPIIERAEALGVGVAFENVFDEGFGKPRFCSKSEELSALIDRFQSKHASACWDFGHAALSYGKEQHTAIEAMGERITCTHVHDNYLSHDSHLPPYFGKIDWNACIHALKAHTKTEVLSFELGYANIKESFAEEAAEMLSRIGEDLLRIP